MAYVKVHQPGKKYRTAAIFGRFLRLAPLTTNRDKSLL
jgi:hypothetical protein